MAIYEGIDVRSIKLSSDQKATDQYLLKTSEENILGKLSLVNFFVGQNNSGKSRFLRGLFVNKQFEGKLGDFDFEPFKKALKNFEINLDKALQSIYGYQPSSIISALPNLMEAFNPLNQRLESGTVPRWDFRFYEDCISTAKVMCRAENGGFASALKTARFSTSQSVVQNSIPIIKQEVNNLISELEEIRKKYPSYEDYSNKNIYVPILRSLRKSVSVNYTQTTVKDYFSWFQKQDWDETSGLQIFNGTNLIKDVADKMIWSSATRQIVNSYENFLSENFFNGQEIKLSPRTQEDVLYIKIGDEERPVYQLGDGIQSVLMLTLPAFFEDKKCMLFIEEPELYLHPGLQRRLIDVIVTDERLSRHQWFFTTHSNVLLDLTLDYKQISVFQFIKKQLQYEVHEMSSGDHRLLADLGVMASSVFRSNVLIWVEGVTDRNYIRELLIKKIEQYPRLRLDEDIHYSFVEFGGGNIKHFNFSQELSEEKINVRRIAEKSFVIIDGDNRNKSGRVEELREALGERIFEFPQKEIENSLPQESVRYAVAKILKSAKKIVNKPICEANISKISKEDYGKPGVFLGRYLDEVLDVEFRKRSSGNDTIVKTYFADSSGTIDEKSSFCNYVLEHINSTSNLFESNEETLSILTDNLLNFIAHSNEISLKDFKAQ